MGYMTGLVGLDFETYSDVDLRTQGLYNYVNSPNFRVLLGAVRYEVEGVPQSHVFDFVREPQDWVQFLALIEGKILVAHNAGFERAVLGRMGVDPGVDHYVDTAVLARAAGFGGSLEASAAQLLGRDKVTEGAELIKVYCIPSTPQQLLGDGAFDSAVVEENLLRWDAFKRYCRIDAELSFDIARALLPGIRMWNEIGHSRITLDMNQTGWPVDLKLVEEMDYRYHRNLEAVELEFRTKYAETDLNLNSPTQMLAWCKARGVSPRSFDEKTVASTLRRVEAKMQNLPTDDSRWPALDEVRGLLLTKQALGGSSLKKLDVILKTTGSDSRLRDQYLHVGAGATFRTSGRGVQMQNLKRLHGFGDDVSTVSDPMTPWSNEQLSQNLRQVFAASHPQGQLIVGDFASVESRGLAWQADEDWKLDAYRMGRDLYKVQASAMFGIPYESITKEQRQIGKVGELACGYGAGADAVRAFADNMGVTLDEGEALKLVRDWRNANDGIVEYWKGLDEMMAYAMSSQSAIGTVERRGMAVVFLTEPAPESLRVQVGNPHLQSLRITMVDRDQTHLLERVVHGVHRVGRNVHYYKPSERKTGPLWSDSFTNPKTKQRQRYNLYGGKLAGILTQSLCRELFFLVLEDVNKWVKDYDNVRLVGQFHDEIVLEWEPGPIADLQGTVDRLTSSMTRSPLDGFPLGAEVKSDRRYIK